MATIKPYQDKKGKTLYCCRVYLGTDNRGKQINKFKRGFKTTKEANLWASQQIVEVNKNGLPQKESPINSLNVKTFGDLAIHWLELHRSRVKPNTIYNIKKKLNNYILPRFGDLPIDKITPLIVQSAVIDWSKSYKAFKNLYQELKRLLAYGVTMGLIEANPCDRVIVPRGQREIDDKLHYWTVSEVNRFLEHAKTYKDPIAFPLFRLLIYTGLRKGEALALRWCDIDFNNLTLTVNQNLSRDEDGKPFLTTPKTKKSRATIPIDRQTAEALKTWKVEQSKRFLVMGASALVDSKALIFRLLPRSLPLDVQRVRLMLVAIAKKAEVPIIRVHDLRHTQATLLLESGANIKDVQERLRHEDIRTTLQTYSHVTEDRKRETIDNLVSYIEV